LRVARQFSPLPRSFFDRDTLIVARELIGQTVVRRVGRRFLAGRIVETEAYIGEDDPACHAARGLTPRTRVMYGPPGYSYVYFTYGMHFMLNVVCEKQGFPAAVLIRAVEPVAGIERMRTLRDVPADCALTNGPAKLCMALSIDLRLNSVDLTCVRSPLQIAEGTPVGRVEWSSRVGIREGTEKMWRCFLPGSRFVSPARVGQPVQK
jgi:DNA-3-methyladenine glycosylase